MLCHLCLSLFMIVLFTYLTIYNAPLHTDWTHFIYMSADNNLDYFALQDLDQMRMNNATNDELNLVVYIDRCLNCYESIPNYGLNVSNVYDCETMTKIDGDFSGSKILQKYGQIWCQIYSFPQELNSLKTDIISNFTALMSQYQLTSKYFMLEFWDHGGAWIGFGEDENKGNQDPSGSKYDGSLDEIFGAVKKGLENTYLGRLDILGFDACIMADFSILNYISNYDLTKYYIASEVSEPGEGWDYTGINASANDLYTYSKAIIDSYVDQGSVSTYTGGAGYTLALFDMDKVSQFLSEYDALVRMMTLAIENYDYGMIMAVLRAQAGTIPAEADFYIDDFGLLIEGLVGDNIYFDSCNERLRDYADKAYETMEESIPYFRADYIRQSMSGVTIFASINSQIINVYSQRFDDYSSQDYVAFLLAMAAVLGDLGGNSHRPLTNMSCYAPISNTFTFNISNDINVEFSLDYSLYKISTRVTPTITDAMTNISFLVDNSTNIAIAQLQANIIDKDYGNTYLTSFWDGNVMGFVDPTSEFSMFSTGQITYSTTSDNSIPRGYTAKYPVKVYDSTDDYNNKKMNNDSGNNGYIQTNVIINSYSSNNSVTSVQLYEIDDGGGISQISNKETKIIEGIATIYINDIAYTVPIPNNTLNWPNVNARFAKINSSIITVGGGDIFGNTDFAMKYLMNMANVSSWDKLTTMAPFTTQFSTTASPTTNTSIMTTSSQETLSPTVNDSMMTTSAKGTPSPTSNSSTTSAPSDASNSTGMVETKAPSIASTSSGSSSKSESGTLLDKVPGIAWLIVVIVLVVIIIVVMGLLCCQMRRNREIGSDYARMPDNRL